jgi:YHS domain-containing protein
MRLLIFLGLLILLSYLVKGLLSPSKSKRMERGGTREVESEMVKDPSCGTYIPKDSAVRAHIDSREYFFCSKQCMTEFKRKTGGNPYQGKGE